MNDVSTPESYIPVRRETVEKRLSRRLDLLDQHLSDDTFKARVDKATLKDLAVVEAIYVDKLLALRGQPNQGVGSDTRAKLGELGATLLAELNRRGLNVKLTERTIEASTLGPEHADAIATVIPE